MSKLYKRLKLWSHSKYAIGLLFFISFIESSIFPIPPDTMLVPMMIANRKKIWFLASLCLIASVLGGILGYFIGYFAFETLGKPLLISLGKSEALAHFEAIYKEYGSIIIFGAGLTPFPYKIITIASGALKSNLGVFIFISIISRGLRFYLEALFIQIFGKQIETILQKHFALITLGLFIIVLIVFLIFKYMV